MVVPTVVAVVVVVVSGRLCSRGGKIAPADLDSLDTGAHLTYMSSSYLRWVAVRLKVVHF